MGLYFWANGIDWNTEDPKDLDAARGVPRRPAGAARQGLQLLPRRSTSSMATTRSSQVVQRRRPSGPASAPSDPENYTWGFGAPASRALDGQLGHPEGRQERGRRLQLHQLHPHAGELGHGPRVPRVPHRRLKDVAELIPKDTKYPDMIFFTDEQLATFQAGEVNTAQQRQVDIYNKAKAKAGA